MHFPFTKKTKQGVTETVGVPHPVSHAFEIHFPKIPSENMTNSGSRKSLLDPCKYFQMEKFYSCNDHFIVDSIADPLVFLLIDLK